MFKKPVKVSAQNQLSGKDRKTMKNKLAETFDQACVDKILNVNDKIISCKITGSKMIIYNGNDYPLFVDGTGKNDYFPSLYVAIAYETLIKVVDINEGVESYIYNGANLMWPGVRDITSLGNFLKDQVVGIRTAKGDIVAIGALGCSLKELQSNADNSGVAVYILHYLNDKLWETGPKTKPQVIVKSQMPKPKQQKKQQPKIQQTKNQKVQKGKIQQENNKKEKKQEQQAKQGKQGKRKGKGKKKDKQSEDEKQEQEVKTKQQKQEPKGKDKNKIKQQQIITQKQKGKGKGKANKKQSSQQKKKQQSEKQQSDGQDDFANLVHSKQQKPSHAQPMKVQKKNQAQKVFSDQQDDKKGKKKPAKKQNKKKGGKKQSDQQEQAQQGQQKQAQEQKSVVSTKLMDQQFRSAFLNALKLSKIEGQLPIDSGRFFMDYMLLARPPGVKLQIKDTSYKKLGKFYQQMSKQKFIQFKHNKDKKGQQGATITKICWDNEQLKNYQPTIMKMNEKDVEQKQQIFDSKKKLRLSTTLQIETAYKLHPNFKNALFAKKVNYAPTQQQQKQMKKQQEQVKNQPQYYSEHQVRALIEKYINDKLVTKRQKDKKQDKQKKTVQKMINIDYKHNQYLADLLKKQIEQYEENAEKQEESGEQQQGKKAKKKKQHIMRIDRGALVNRILKTCSTSYQMRDKQTGLQAFNEGTFKGIQLIAQKSNNKNITKILGLETFIIPKSQTEEQINGFANLLKEKFASSVNIQNLPGKNAGKEIIVHGNFINELEQMFTQEYKIKQDYITSQNKLDKKKKR